MIEKKCNANNADVACIDIGKNPNFIAINTRYDVGQMPSIVFANGTFLLVLE